MSKTCKQAVIFHEYVSSRKTQKGVVVCTLSPLPMSEWNKSTSTSAYVSVSDKLSETIESVKAETSEDLDDFTRGYDEGYINALKYALKLLKEK